MDLEDIENSISSYATTYLNKAKNKLLVSFYNAPSAIVVRESEYTYGIVSDRIKTENKTLSRKTAQETIQILADITA